MFVLAHLSDPHLGPVRSFNPLELWGKRGLGMINWQFRRRRKHARAVLDAVVADMRAQAPDHIAVTGDLVNLALPSEFPPALDFLARLGTPERVSFVPGNHDSYVRAVMSHPQLHWGAYMRGDAAPGGAYMRGDAAPGGAYMRGDAGQTDIAQTDGGTAGWPYVRRRGPVVIIGLSTSVPTGLFMATGRLGDAQLRRAAAELARYDQPGLFRLVLMHHPPVPTPGDHLKRLVDAQPLRELLRQHGADLILHGHTHLRSLAWLPGPARAIPVVGVPSASAPEHHGHTAGYNIFRIEPDGGGFSCEMIALGLAADQTRIVELERHALGTKSIA